MEITLYGIRGSIPAPSHRRVDGSLFSTAKHGGNTSCIYLCTPGGKHHILDAGTGLRVLGNWLMAETEFGEGEGDANLYLSHTHWDHIQGFPFFAPAYAKGNRIDLRGQAGMQRELIGSVEQSLQQIPQRPELRGIFSRQQDSPNFPVPIDIMDGIGTFYDFQPGSKCFEDDETVVSTLLQKHPGNSVGYRFTDKKGGAAFVYSTDFEPDNGPKDLEMAAFWREADIVYADTQYELGSQENPYREGWGHSHLVKTIELASRAQVRKLILGHLEPTGDDEYYRGFEERARAFAGKLAPSLEILVAREGERFCLGNLSGENSNKGQSNNGKNAGCSGGESHARQVA